MDTAGPPGQIEQNPVLLEDKPRRPKKLKYRIGLGRADLDQEMASGHQELACAVGDPPIGRKPIRPTVERPQGIVPGDLPGQRGDLPGRDIGRIGHDQVVASGNPLEPVRPGEAGARRNPRSCGQGRVRGSRLPWEGCTHLVRAVRTS